MAGLRQASGMIEVRTMQQGLVEITREVTHWLAAQGMRTGLLTVFCRHTSASLLVQENAARAVRSDTERYFATLAPESDAYEHDEEGPDDMPAHLRTVLTGVSLSVPIADGRLMLGTWQGLFLFEHRRRPHRREVALHVLGE